MDPGPDPSHNYLLQLLVIAILTLINACFSASEMAIVSVNKNKIKILAAAENKRAKLLLDLIEEPNKFLSTIQVSITLAGFLASAVAATGMSDDLGRVFAAINLPYERQVAVVVVTLILSYFTLVFGELFPKRIALLHSTKIALASVRPLMVMSRIAAPFVWLLSKSVSLLMRLTKQHNVAPEEEFSEEEVKSMIEAGQESGVLKEEGAKMINSIFAFDDKFAYEVMTPRTDVFSIDIDDPESEYIDELMELRYSRIPVYEDDLDNIIGILNIKDYLIKAREHGFDNINIRDILRKPYFIPESKKIDVLFRELQLSKQHIAILIDEHGGFSGIVTMEDLVEEIVGEIADEYDEADQEIEKIDDRTYRLNGLVSLKNLNEDLDLDLDSENSETLGGFLLEILGKIPREDVAVHPVVEHEGYTFIIEKVLDRRIDTVKMILPPEEGEGEEADENTSSDQTNETEMENKGNKAEGNELP
ncbi:MAG TPA: HlyC/CorC family transporter [Clostridiales bacterium]|nr:HlyC/CorC family transporter [Clostridiales bacterium]